MTLLPRLAVLLALSALLGCGSVNPLDGGAPNYLNYSGNWLIAPTGVNGVPTLPLLSGSLSSQGAQITGTLRVLSSKGCVAPYTLISVSGTQDKFYIATLTSTSLPDNPVSITLIAPPIGSTPTIGTYTFSGNGPCATPKTDVIGQVFQPVTGTYTGAFTNDSKVTATVTAVLTQATSADAGGQFPITGTLKLAAATCTTDFTVSGSVSGPLVSLDLVSASSQADGKLTGGISPDATQFTLPPNFFVVGSCSAGMYTGALKRQ